MYDLAAPNHVDHTIGYHRKMLLADIEGFRTQQRFLIQSDAPATPYRWRSGVKHDCAKVMEFRSDNGGLRNGFGECVDIENTYLYPMLKGSDVANGDKRDADRFMLVTQREIGEATDHIQRDAPKTLAISSVARPVAGRARQLNLSDTTLFLRVWRRTIHVRAMEGLDLRAV